MTGLNKAGAIELSWRDGFKLARWTWVGAMKRLIGHSPRMVVKACHCLLRLVGPDCLLKPVTAYYCLQPKNKKVASRMGSNFFSLY